MFDNWTHAEVISLFTAIAATVAAFGTFWNAKKAAALHLEINSRMTQLLAATHAQGGMEERAAADARDVAQSIRKDAREDAKSTLTPQS
jgi:hypothetical protein